MSVTSRWRWVVAAMLMVGACASSIEEEVTWTLVVDGETVRLNPSEQSVPRGCNRAWEELATHVWWLQQCTVDLECGRIDVPLGAPTGLSGEGCCVLPLGAGREQGYLDELDAYYDAGCRPEGQICALCGIKGNSRCIDGRCRFER